VISILQQKVDGQNSAIMGGHHSIDMLIIPGVLSGSVISEEDGKFSGHPLNLSGLFALAHPYRAGLAWRS
jgi:hypothetical protein